MSRLVLVTGAAGFAGRHLVRLCIEKGVTIVGVGRSPAAQVNLPCELDRYIQVDLLDAEATRAAVASTKPDLVFHLAAEASVHESWHRPGSAIEHNLLGTFNLLESIRECAAGARALIACSGEEYGTVPPDQLPATEEQPLRPQSPYGFSKASVDLLGGFYADAHDLHIVRTRAFNHAGPGQSDRFVISSFARQIAEAEATGVDHVELATGNVEVRRDFSDVRDVVRGYWIALEAAGPGVFNICSGHSLRLAEVLERLGDLATIGVTQRTDPRRLRKRDIVDLFGSRARFTAATGWEPAISFETTLDDTLTWWRSKTSTHDG
jgi:GDP-4-dehydro-6-deoxy-D-mannose reductase